ncbi:MAG: 2-dehydro-3-deoxyphosphogluconate aldolase [Paenibacillaceae bacterium]|jgi:2-dehydro-3-deoxyphosphogluconate aldolase/(4S)-4-hydroxy-2-oxoglutarate aldolase|nr:2-dehydro-3-deoxyphosphogluconate aldolase [Paenibacillaceae bacterium]
MKVLDRIQEHFIVAIIRGAGADDVLPAVSALYEGGIRVLELTVTTPGVLTLIEQVRSAMPEDLVVGAGTVLDPETARAAIMAGAQFILSPTIRPETIAITKRYGIVSIPGAMTPSEILTAYELGADIVKVFPAGSLGPKYIKDVNAPLPQIPLMPTGGVGLDNIGAYVRAGAVAAGLGNSLYAPPLQGGATDSYFAELKERAVRFVEEVHRARTAQG